MSSEATCWYFAYGSNMRAQQMTCRIGRRDIDWKVGYIRNYQLVFNKPAGDGTGYANIEPQNGGIVYGVLYMLTEEEMKTLDKREGVGKGHYRRKNLEVTIEDDGQVTADAYIAAMKQDGLRPRSDYLQLIVEGAKDHHLPQEYIEKLEKTQVAG